MRRRRPLGRFQWSLAQQMVGVAVAVLDVMVLRAGYRHATEAGGNLHGFIGATIWPSLAVIVTVAFLARLIAPVRRRDDKRE